MGGGKKLACVHGFGNSGLPHRNQIRRNDLRVFANSMEYLDVTPRAQGLIGLIGYSYQQVATSFLEAHLLRTPRLSVLGLERWVTDREVLPGGA